MKHRPLGRRIVRRVTLSYTSATTAGLTHDITVFVVPSKTTIHTVIADTTTQWAGTAGTILLSVGTSAGAADLVAEHDVETATVVNQGIVVPGGNPTSWTGTTTITARVRSTSGNVGDGTDTLLSGGATDLYIVTEELG